MMSNDVTISIKNVWEKYRLYHDRTRSLKEIFVKFSRARYEDLWALRDVTFNIMKGETLGLIGSNGSGKSTLPKCVARVLFPTCGTIEVKGRVSALLELGAGFHPDLTGRENIFINGAMLGMTRRQILSKFDEIVAFSEIEPFIDSPVRNYSSGMYMRLGFSIAVHVDPDILLIDEVLAVGDDAFQAKCIDKVNAFKKAGKTILFVSHDMAEVKKMCNKVVWLDQGKVKKIGATREIIATYSPGTES